MRGARDSIREKRNGVGVRESPLYCSMCAYHAESQVVAVGSRHGANREKRKERKPHVAEL